MPTKKEGNLKKYLSYREAWTRINNAIEFGFYFEAITLEESIIYDRLYSFLRGNKVKQIDIRTPLKQIIIYWRKFKQNPIKWELGNNLIDTVDKWRDDRNKMIHGMVKSEPGNPTVSVTIFLNEAKRIAKTGKILARAVIKWQRKDFVNLKRK